MYFFPWIMAIVDTQGVRELIFSPHRNIYYEQSSLVIPHLGKYRRSSSCKGRCHIAAWFDWQGKGEAVRGNSFAVLPRRRAE